MQWRGKIVANRMLAQIEAGNIRIISGTLLHRKDNFDDTSDDNEVLLRAYALVTIPSRTKTNQNLRPFILQYRLVLLYSKFAIDLRQQESVVLRVTCNLIKGFSQSW